MLFRSGANYAANTEVDSGECNGTGAQAWEWYGLGTNLYLLRPVADISLCATAMTNGYVELQACSDSSYTSDQVWEPEIGNVVNYGTGDCLDVHDGAFPFAGDEAALLAPPAELPPWRAWRDGRAA